MMRALYSSVAGLRTHQTKMDVLGNNISNVNTVGFKSSRVTFSTMMYQTLTGASGPNGTSGGINAKQIGLGVSYAATSMDIETGGASENTGKAFDLKISDKNTTSFFIVNTGTENVFTRAGAFYVDSSGTLCMESTGYQVMGWQVDENGNINKNTVSPLRIMSAENQTSQPEFTTRGKCSGILDDNSPNVNSDTGYNMSLNFYDNLGYAYNAKFAIQKTGDKGEYTVNLLDIIDANGKSMVTQYGQKLGNLFGSGSQGSHVDVTNSYTIASGKSNALKKLALTPKPGTEDGTFNLTYNYSSELINQCMGSKLPSGLTIEYVIPTDENGTYTKDETTGMIEGTTVRVRDSSGADVTDTYASQPQFAVLFGGTVDDTGAVTPPDEFTNMYQKITAMDIAQKWVDLNQLEKSTRVDPNPGEDKITHYKLNSSQIDQLKSTFPTLGFDGLTTDNIELQVNGEDNTISFAAVGDDTQAAVDILNSIEDGGAVRTYTLNDYMNQAYLTIDAAQANGLDIFTSQLPEDLEIRFVEGDGSFKIVTPSEDGFKLSFSTADGTLNYIGQNGNTTQTLKLSLMATEENPFTDIQIDFSALKNLANGGTSTAGLANGNGSGEGTGKKVGTMIGLSVDSSGMVFASYSNGNTSLVGQIPVARFANASGLESIGDNCFRSTMNSGDFDGIGEEINSDGSTINAGTLEMSNVDLATEFTQMITTQRGYQANSRVISTSDSILEELVNLKR